MSEIPAESTTEEERDAGPTRFADLGEIKLAYESFGDPGDPPLLLVMGLGMQLLGWREELCEQLAERGFHVVRFDNRDCGLSTRLEGEVNLRAGMLGFTGSAVYDLYDMADDTVGLLDHLGAERAHLVGASMGGMVAQTVAARHPSRALSLCSIMSASGRRRLNTIPRPDILRLLLRRPASSREAYVEDTVSLLDKIGSPGYPSDPDEVREQAAMAYERGFYPPGVARQMMAILASGDRTSDLASIEAPTVVVHGSADRLVPPAAGRVAADAIPGARLVEIDGMGHDLPQDVWPRLIELISENAARAGD